MIKKTIALVSGIMLLAGFIGLCWKLDSRWAYTTALAASEARIGKIEDRVRLREIEPVVWRLESLYEGKKMPPEVRAEYERVKSEKQAIEKKLGIR